MATLPESPRILVLGAGALGLYYGGLLRHAGADVHWLARSGYDDLKDHGLEIRRAEEDAIHLAEIPVYPRPQDAPAADLVLVAAKATANDELRETLRVLDSGSNLFLTLQNGLGNIEALADVVGPERVLGMLCFVCVNRLAGNVVENFLPGSVALGRMQGPTGPDEAILARLFSAAGIELRQTENLNEALWRKLVWNVPFNGLAIAAGGIPTDAILARPELEELTRELMAEVITAASRRGVEIPLSFIDKQVDVTRRMGAYRPSSLIDFQEGRPVEVESIWGEPLRRAEKTGAKLPHWRMLYALLQALTDPEMP